MTIFEAIILAVQIVLLGMQFGNFFAKGESIRYPLAQMIIVLVTILAIVLL